MKKHRSLAFLCVTFFAAALFALPVGAWADEIHLKQSDFQNEDGSYELLQLRAGNTYVLDESAYGCVSVGFDYPQAPEISFDLNGNTLTCPSSYDYFLFEVLAGKLTVKNGNLVQPNSGQALAYVRFGGGLTLDLGEGNSATCTDSVCVYVGSAYDDGRATIKSGTYENKNQSGSNTEVLTIRDGSRLTIDGGVILRNGDSPIAALETGGSFVLNGGSYNAYPDAATSLDEGKMLYANNYPDGLFCVDDAEDIKKSNDYYVATGSSAIGDVAFKTRDEALAFAKALGLGESSVGSYIYSIYFDGNGGTPTTYDTTVHYGDTVSGPTVTRDGYRFLGWTDASTGADFDLSTPPNRDVSLKAKWFNIVAKIGDVEYESLQDAVNAAQDGDTVVLCKDATEAVEVPAGGKLTIDLGGNTLTAPSTGSNLNAISLTGARGLTVDNGTVLSRSRCVYADGSLSTGSTLTLGSKLSCVSSVATFATDVVDVESKEGAEAPTKLIIQGGSYTNANGGGAALRVDGAELSILGGQFTSESDSTISLRDTTKASFLCNISGHIDIASYISKDKVSILPGTTFGDDKDKGYIDADACHLLKDADTKRYVVSEHQKKWITDKEPTETVPGWRHQECSTDGCDWKTDGEEIPATGSAPVIKGLENGKSYDLEDGGPAFTVKASSLKEVTVNGQAVEPSEQGVYTLSVTGEGIVITATDNNGKSTTITVSCYQSHDWGAWEGAEDGTHHRSCKHSGCAGYQDGKCSGGTATCKTKAVCSTCGASYGDLNPSNHEGNVVWGYSGSEHWKVCLGCGKEISGTRAAHDLVSGHDQDEHWKSCECGYETAHEGHSLAWKHDEQGTHWQECSGCSYATESAAHRFGSWEATAEGHERTCLDCGYAQEGEHSLVWVTDKEATAAEDGSQHEECETCGYRTGATKVVPKTGGDGGEDEGGDSGKKGEGSGDEGGSEDVGSKEDAEKLPATGDDLPLIPSIAAVSAALAGLGVSRRRMTR